MSCSNLVGVQRDRKRILREHLQPVAHPPAGVLGAHGKVAAQDLDLRRPADDPLDLPAERHAEVGADADLLRDPLSDPSPPRGDVEIPSPGGGVADGAVAEYGGGEHLP